MHVPCVGSVVVSAAQAVHGGVRFVVSGPFILLSSRCAVHGPSGVGTACVLVLRVFRVQQLRGLKLVSQPDWVELTRVSDRFELWYKLSSTGSFAAPGLGLLQCSWIWLATAQLDLVCYS